MYGFSPKTLDALLENLMTTDKYKRKVLNSANIELFTKMQYRLAEILS